MSKFTFQNEDEDGSVTTIEFEAEVWLDAFPKFLQLCRGAGFSVNEDTALYAPTASRNLFGDRHYLIFEDELASFGAVVAPESGKRFDGTQCVDPVGKTLEQWASEGGANHAFGYYDLTRNK